MGEVAYTSQVRIERVRGPLRRAWIPAEREPVLFGVHGAVARHYGVDMAEHEPHATTLDYVVAAAAGWLTGTLGGALEARKIPAGEGQLSAEAVGEVEAEEKVLVIKRIRVRYYLRLRADQREAAERAHAAHQHHCPVARTLKGAVEITTELHVEEEP